MKKRGLTALALAGALLLSTPAFAAEEKETVIRLSDAAVTVDGKAASTDPTAAVYVGADIVYYEDLESYESGAAYGEGTGAERHTAAEAEGHTVVTITRPGTYRLSGSLSAGQVAVDLGKEAGDDPGAVVTLILDNVDVTCTVAPALIFYNVYECDRAFVAYDNEEDPAYQSSAIVDTTAAGANVVIAAGSENTFTGSHVARIYKEGSTKKLHKYDGAFYSKMSMNIFGDKGDNSGVLNIIADNEGLDSELHLTINGGTINIRSQDDGINTNEDFVSVTTVNGGELHIAAGLGAEGDGIDSNGYLVINGGTVWTSANPQTGDGGIDADSPILLNGGSVYAFGSRNDAADSTSAQAYMELSFASTLPAGSQIRITDGEGNEKTAFSLDRACQSMTLSLEEAGAFALDTVYHVYVDDVLQCWNGNGFGMMGGHGGMGGGRPGGMELPEGVGPGRQPDLRPEVGADIPEEMDRQEWPGPIGKPGEDMEEPGTEPSGGFAPGRRPDGFAPFGGQEQAHGSGSTDFVLTETTRSFSGVCDSDASGKTRVSFGVEGAVRSGRNTIIESVTAITPSVDLDPALVQITVTDDPSENYSASCLLSEGLEAVNALLSREDGTYILTVAVVSGVEGYTGTTQFSFTVGALPFVDVQSFDSGYAAIEALYRAGVMTGTGENTFSPEMTVTRAQAVTALARLAGAEERETAAFSDVEPEAWYAGYVAWAVDKGIVEGDGQGRFLPDETVTAGQMAMMLKRYTGDEGYAADFAGELNRAELARMLYLIME